MENKNYKEMWHSSRLLLTDEFNTPQILLKNGENNIATVGNLSVTLGKAKSRKSFHTSIFLASLLGNKFVKPYSGNLSDSKRKILHIDTEQSQFHSMRFFKGIVSQSALSLNIQPKNFEYLCVRGFSTEDRIKILEEAIKGTPNLGFVSIDGIRDLVFDINSPSESTNIITKLMKWTEDYKIHIHVVLHTNKTDDNARGHLGTELLNKAETVLQIMKDSKNPDISIVKPIAMRDVEFEEFAFKINGNGIPEIIDDFDSSSTLRPLSYAELTEEQHRIALEKVFEKTKLQGYTDLVSNLKSAYKLVGLAAGNGKIKQLKVFLENKGMIIKDKDKNYRLSSNF